MPVAVDIGRGFGDELAGLALGTVRVPGLAVLVLEGAMNTVSVLPRPAP